MCGNDLLCRAIANGLLIILSAGLLLNSNAENNLESETVLRTVLMEQATEDTQSLPDSLKQYSAVIESTVDFERVKANLLTEEEKAKSIEIAGTINVYERANNVYQMNELMLEENGAISVEIYSYPGHFSFRRSVSDKYIRSDYSEGEGVLSEDGLIGVKEFSPEHAKQMSDQILDKLNLPFSFEWYETEAYIPTEETYLTIGFYVVDYRITLDGIPVEMKYASSFNRNHGEPEYTPANMYGVRVKVFQDGVYEILCEWFDLEQGPREINQMISAKEAWVIAEELLNDRKYVVQNDVNFEAEDVNSVEFGYVVTTDNKKQKYVIVPCWNFLVSRTIGLIYKGIRINAENGEIISVSW